MIYRPLQEADLEAVHASNVRAFDDLDRRLGRPYLGGPPPPVATALLRLCRLLSTDPGGSWVAERDGEVVGCALALLREGLWGLSLLFVDPSAQGSGAGRELLARAHRYGDGARGHVILSSTDPRAMRAYARLGLALHPCVAAHGTPSGVRMPPGVRVGGPEDLPLTEAVDRAVRGAAHGHDILTMLAAGSTLLVAPERGYAVVRDGSPRLVAAFDEASARLALRGALAQAAEAGRPVLVESISAAQPWALDVCLEAGLEPLVDTGPVFLAGDVGPFRPYLPSGAYL